MRKRQALLLSIGGLPFAAPSAAYAIPLSAMVPSIAAIDPDWLLPETDLPETGVGDRAAFMQNDAATAEQAAPAVTVNPVAAERAPKLNPTGRDITLSAPLRDGNFVLSEVSFILGADDSLRVDTKSFLDALRPVLAAEKIADLQNKLTGLDYAPVATFEQLGYIVRYDPATIGITVQIPADVRTARDLSLRRFDDPSTGNFYLPAALSGYVNFRGFADYIWSGADRGFQAPTSLIDSAIRYKNVVLENEATLSLGSSNRSFFSREGTRLVYDDRNRLIRFAAGDLISSSRGFAGSPQIAGLSAQRIYSIVDPLRSVQPTGDRTFTLTRPGTLEALINGRPIRSVRLEPGVYNVRDFPFVQGTNNVQFNITDDAGGVQSIAFSQFFDRTLLAPGLTEFSLQAGIFAPFSSSSRSYQFDEPAASGWFRRGVSDALTLGGNFSARDDGVALGAEVTVASAFGIFGADFAFSQVRDAGTGFAGNLSLQKSFGGYTSIARSIELSAEYRSKNFTNPGFGGIGVDNRITWNLSAGYSQPIAASQYLSVSGNYSIARSGFSNAASARLNYTYNINQRFNLSLDATYEDTPVFGREYGVRATLLVRLGRRSTGVAEVDSRTKRARIGYQTSRGEGVGAWTGSADLDVGEEDVGFNGGFNYTANRAELGVNHTTVYEFTGQRTDSQRTSIRAGTAIVFADGKFGLSRPIFDSFAMVAPHKSLNGAQVVLDPRENYYTAKSGMLGPAVEPNLAAYIRRTVTYDVPNAPIGYDLGTGSAKVMPPYRGGYLITAGSDYSVTALGTLIGTDGVPISLLAGKATEIGVTDPKTLTIFTNRTGRFGVSGMREGRWRIEMPTEPPTVVEVEIPDEALGVVRLGEVKLGDPK
jgi:outer membrane usher protein